VIPIKLKYEKRSVWDLAKILLYTLFSPFGELSITKANFIFLNWHEILDFVTPNMTYFKTKTSLMFYKFSETKLICWKNVSKDKYSWIIFIFFRTTWLAILKFAGDFWESEMRQKNRVGSDQRPSLPLNQEQLQWW
jgi:hypothetical protein